MSQIQVRDSLGNPISDIRIRYSIGDLPSDQARDDKTSDDAGNLSFPYYAPSPNGYTLYINNTDTKKKWEQTSLRVNSLDATDIPITLKRAPLKPIELDGDYLKCDDNRFIIAGASNFMLPQLVAEGIDIVPLLYRGPNFLRIFNTHQIISQQVGLKPFHPTTYSNWLEANEKCISICNANGYYVEANLICDNQLFGMDANYLRNMQDQFIEMFKSKMGIYSLGNENDANGFNANDFTKPSNVISACGSGLSGGPAPLCNGQAWDIQFQHLRRDSKMFIDIPPVDAPTYGLQHRLMFDETIGFANHNESGRRTTSRDWARQIGIISSAYTGAIIMIENGAHSNPLNQDEQDCLDAFVEGTGI